MAFGINLEGLLEILDGLVQFPEIRQRLSPVTVSISLSGIDFDGLPVMLDGPVEFSLLLEHQADIGEPASDLRMSRAEGLLASRALTKYSSASSYRFWRPAEAPRC